MKKAKITLAVLALLASAAVSAQTHVKGYYRANGTYVQSHYRSAANSTTLDNYSTRGNVKGFSRHTCKNDSQNPISFVKT
ncbi:hypothetical protein ACE15N_19215 [Xanthomonas campestris pv. passiflorae]|uniref:hypothetical protein n=2 Tax=Xanthomonas TaxID=338 RepID=UPI000528850C|nr:MULTISPECIES: hypothetical protein [Xanthomonas]MBV6816131.1 hypothetical protein [Xanthomonas campestris pv. passiflorae]